jgi:hypothetical protein
LEKIGVKAGDSRDAQVSVMVCLLIVDILGSSSIFAIRT